LRPDQIATAEELLRAGKSLNDTARTVGCSQRTISVIRKRIRNDKAA
jgi:hypothetical protein